MKPHLQLVVALRGMILSVIILAALTAFAATPGQNTDLPADWSPNRTRPLCPYPAVAIYKGSGDIEDASSFVCK